MKKILGVAAFAAGLVAAEWQGGSDSEGKKSVPPEFDTPRIIAQGEPRRDLKALRVMTWNIDRGGDFKKITQELKENPADLCLLQEVDSHTKREGEMDELAELSRSLQMPAAYAIEFEELSQEGKDQPAYTGQATLARIPVRAVRVLRFERQSGFWKPRSWVPSSMPLMQRRLGSRIALVSELEFNGGLLVVYNVHLESRSAGAIQERQLDEIFQDSRRYPPETLVLIGGDLNSKYTPGTFLHELEKQGYRSALGERIERTHTIAMALDWIFAKGAVLLSDGEVRRDLKGSDHYPIYTLLSAK